MKYLWAALITLWLLAAVYLYANYVIFNKAFGKVGLKKAPIADKKDGYERVNIFAADEIVLTAKLFTPENGDGAKSVVLCHGYRSNGEADFEEEIRIYESLGYNILLIEQRCHGKSGGDITTLGLTESFDVVYWCKWLELRFGTGCSVVVHGCGMGGFAVLGCLANPELPRNVEKGVVKEVFDDIYEVFTKWTDDKYGFLKKMIIPVVNMFYRHSTGFDMREGHLKRFVKKISVPVLFVDTDENSYAFKSTKTALKGTNLKDYLEK